MSVFEALKTARTVMVLRTDAIGDNVIGGAMLGALRAAVPKARIVYVCQDRAAELFGACPHVAEVISFSRGRCYADEGYRGEIGRKLAGVKAEVVLNPVLTREPLGDSLVAGSGAGVRVGFAGTGVKGCNDGAYTELIGAAEGWRLELERVGEFLKGVGIEAQAGKPEVWLRATDESFAREVLARQRFDPALTVVLYGGALAEYRVSREIGRALGLAFPDGGMNVVSVGAAHEFGLHEELMGGYSGRHLNLCGRTSLLQMAALIKQASLAVGAETGAVHVACAVGTRNVVVVGGGHFGRFVPWSALTTSVCLPLGCFRCDWQCRHQKAHCVADLSAESIAAGIVETMKGASSKPRVFAQGARVDGPAGADVRDYLKAESIAIISPAAGVRLSTTAITVGARKAAVAVTDEFRVTAIVSTYKSERFIRGCLQDLVNQTLFERGQLEILVIDSASPEGEGAVVREFQEAHGTGRIRYHRTAERETLYASWNRAIDLARGTFLTNANTDDRHHPEMLARLAEALDARGDCALAYCDSEITHEANGTWEGAARVRSPVWPDYTREGLFALPFVGPHPMWRKSVHREVGYFDASMIAAGDYEFWLRLSLRWEMVHVRESLGLYLENPESLSLGNVGLTWYETRVARERYWKKEWGADPSQRGIVTAFEDFSRRAQKLASGVRVALFGAGQHTGRHLERFRAALEPHAELVAVLDDRAGEGRVLGGVPVVQSERWRELAIDAVVVSSDTYEAAMVARVKNLTASSVPILAVYKHSLDHKPAAEFVRAGQ